MKYRFTPLNIFCALLAGVAIYCAIKPGEMSWGLLLSFYLTPVIIIGLLIDYALQSFIARDRYVIIIESIIIAPFLLWIFSMN